MTIIIKDLAGDSGNIILKDLQFSEGKYEIDLGGRKFNNCRLEHEKIISDSKLIEQELWKINNDNFIVTKTINKAEPLAIGETFTIDSKILGEKRRINVYIPSIYLESQDTKLPVIYMPDGGIAEDFLHVAGLLQVSLGNQTMRPFLLVGIENTERRRDMTGFTENEDDKKIAIRVGGSENFRKFLKNELMPQIKERYQTTNETVIIGESLAGLFVMETFFLEPDLFDTYIAFDPSLWWNNQKLVKMADKQLPQPKLKKNLYFASSNEKVIADITGELAKILSKHAPSTLRWHYEKMPEEKHSTIYHPAALKAFRMLFKPTQDNKE
ncbi:MAG: alpha/beta hydrolase [Acidobacteria bacterium]|nr:alpha/beta hydrolase [Acidobacteriota bacterium]